MRKCWALHPVDRPNFADLIAMLAEVGLSDEISSLFTRQPSRHLEMMLWLHANITSNVFFFYLRFQAKPAQFQATREFSEHRKLLLAPNDTVTVIDHG